jgi:hypothetical protein
MLLQLLVDYTKVGQLSTRLIHSRYVPTATNAGNQVLPLK